MAGRLAKFLGWGYYMKRHRLLFILGIVTLAGAIHGQSEGSITMQGGLAVDEGGLATMSGFLQDSVGGPSGRFDISFDSGSLVYVKMIKVREVQIPGSTAFFTGEAVAVINENGRVRLARGEIVAMVDDLDLNQLPFPDQLFLQFRTRDGQLFIRHARTTTGDITIRLP